MNNAVGILTTIIGMVIGGLIFSFGVKLQWPDTGPVTVFLMFLGIAVISAFEAWMIVSLSIR